MALIQPDFGDQGEDRAVSGAVGADAAELERRLIQDGEQVIASGALICPGCELPLPGRPAVRASAIHCCSWCGHTAPARDLLRVGVIDAPANQVSLVARIRA